MKARLKPLARWRCNQIHQQNLPDCRRFCQDPPLFPRICSSQSHCLPIYLAVTSPASPQGHFQTVLMPGQWVVGDAPGRNGGEMRSKESRIRSSRLM